MSNIIKIVLAALFFICLFDMPYGYYQFVRFAGLIGLAILAYQANQLGRQIEIFIYGGLALLFQPLFKIALGRQIWNIVDLVVGIGLIISIFIKPNSQHTRASTFAWRTKANAQGVTSKQPTGDTVRR